MSSKLGTVAIAGASGFIGRALIAALRPDFEIIALSRSDKPAEPGLAWRRCDLFSLLQSEAALAGADYAIYLVQSPQPRSGLIQASYEDLDLILADNFVRAARRAGVRQIVYLGNLIPPHRHPGELPRYLRSRLEVEEVLSAYEIPVTLLRAPVVIGAQGAAFELAVDLVRKLRIMLVPRWTQTPNQPLALDDAVACIRHVLGDARFGGRSFDIAGPEVVSYLSLIQATARALTGTMPKAIPIPLLTPHLSRYWLAWATGLPLREIIPLIESLMTQALATELKLQAQLERPPLSLAAAIEKALRARPAKTRVPAPPAAPADPYRDLRSVQRLPLQPGEDALWLSKAYANLLGSLLRPIMRAEIDPDHSIRLYQRGLRKPLLQLDYSPSRSTPDRALFYINGGLLAQQTPGVPSRLEFRVIPGGNFAIAGIHDFRPRLPWYLYLLTQANFHLWTMYAFIWYLRFRQWRHGRI